MSHVTNLKLRVKDLEALETGGRECDLEFRENQRTHRWYGHFVGDTTPPKGMKPEDYGKCLHALVLKNAGPSDYEIGVVKALDGGEGYDLVCDTWRQARLLEAVGGPNLNKLRREYAAAAALKKANATLQRKGFVAHRENLAGGAIRLRLQKR